MKHNILPGLTTTPGSDWRGKIHEIDKFQIKEIALFPTSISANERQEMYSLLEKTHLSTIPQMHLRNNDHSEEEIKYVVERFHTKLFNIHPLPEAQVSYELMLKMKIPVYFENVGEISEDFEEMLNKTAGLCVDFSHYYDHWMIEKEDGYKSFPSIISKYKIGCCHVSAIRNEKSYEFNNEYRYGRHSFVQLSDLDYMSGFIRFLPEVISLELENSFEEQLEAKEYLMKIIKGEKV